jgi:BASS family bile acid:Na+ symporter
MSLLALMKLLIVISIVLSVTALAMRANAGDVLHLFRNWRLGLRAFVAIFVVVPAIALVMALTFQLKPEVKVALLVLSLSPIPPLLPKKQHKTGGEDCYITGLLVAASLASLVVMPFGLLLFGVLFGVDTELPLASVAKTLLITIGAPMLLGFIAQRLLGARAEPVARVVGKAAMLLLLVCGLVVLVMVAPAMWRLVGGGTLVALLAMILAGLGAGYLLGGPSHDNRAVLALAAAARHPGVALGVIAVDFPEMRLATAAVLLSVLLNALVGIPFMRVIRGPSGPG